MRQTELERLLALEIGTVRSQFSDVPEPEIEYRFHPTRRWRFDFAWPTLMVAAEAEGGTYVQGRHTRGKGFADDCEKYNTAATRGWFVLRFPKEHIRDGYAFLALYEMFEHLGLKPKE